MVSISETGMVYAVSTFSIFEIISSTYGISALSTLEV